MKYLTLKNILILAGIALIVFTVIQCNGNKKMQAERVELEKYKTDYETLSKIIDSLNTESVTIRDSLPTGKVVEEPTLNFGNEKKLLKTIQELRSITAANAHLRRQLEKADSVNATITQKQIDDGFAWGEVVPVEKALPVVKTEKRDTGEHYTYYRWALSHGNLLSWGSDIKVTPEIIFKDVPGETKYLTKDNYLGLSGGVLNLDLDNISLDNTLLPFSVVYHRKWWGLEGGIITNKEFKSIDGGQVKFIAGIRW